jgi:hypothetical protein
MILSQTAAAAWSAESTLAVLAYGPPVWESTAHTRHNRIRSPMTTPPTRRRFRRARWLCWNVEHLGTSWRGKRLSSLSCLTPNRPTERNDVVESRRRHGSHTSRACCTWAASRFCGPLVFPAKALWLPRPMRPTRADHEALLFVWSVSVCIIAEYDARVNSFYLEILRNSLVVRTDPHQLWPPCTPSTGVISVTVISRGS